MAVLRKVGIIGIGHVGAHVANALLSAGLAEELKLCDINEQKVVSECQDLSDTLGFYPHNCVIGNYGTQYEQLADCDVVINAAGDVKTSAKDRDGELFVTTDIARTWISRLFNAGFHGVIITISNPCDVVATEIWHITGYDPRKIIGTGTALDSARLRNAIAKRVNVDQKSIGAYMLGEHGNSQFAYWSNVNIAGKPLDQLAQDDPQRFALDEDETEQDARRGGYRVYAGKECTEYAIAATAARLTQAVLCDEHYATACSTLLTGEQGESGNYASLPCIIGANGVEEVLSPTLTENEQAKFHASCEHIRANIAQLAWWDDECHPMLRG